MVRGEVFIFHLYLRDCITEVTILCRHRCQNLKTVVERKTRCLE